MRGRGNQWVTSKGNTAPGGSLQEQTCFVVKAKKEDWPVTVVIMMPLRETPGHSANEEMKYWLRCWKAT